MKNEIMKTYLKKLMIKDEIKKLNEEKINLINKLSELQEECSHELVIAYDDHTPHKIGQIIDYYCPLCGKKVVAYPTREIEKSEFKNSKIIDLTKYPMLMFYQLFDSINEYVINNYDYCNESDEFKNEIEESLLNSVKNNELTKVLTKKIRC